MGLVKWDTRLETGHSKIDEQHRTLVDAFNSLHLAMKEGRGRDEVGKLLIFLKDYTVSHFRMEEALMGDHGYPEMGKHRGIHHDLVSQVAELADKYQKGIVTLSLPMMNFLEDWLIKHIQGEDFRLAEFLRRKNA